MADAPERAVGLVEGELADARVLLQQRGLAGLRIQAHQVAVVAVVGGVVEDAVPLVVGQRRDGVDHRPLEAHDPLDLAGLHVERADVRDDAGVVEGGVDAVAASGRSRRATPSPARGVVRSRCGVIGYWRIASRFFCWNAFSATIQSAQALSSDRPKTWRNCAGVVAAAARLARHPVQHLLGRVGARQPREEPRAVEIRVDLELEVDLRAFRHQRERVVERRVVANHRAEDHLVEAALRAADAAGHPRVDEHGAAFVKPARRGHARRGQVEVEHRFGLLGQRHDLAAEQRPEEPIVPRRLVHRHDVHQLVVHDRVHPLVGRNRLERVGQRRDLDRQRVAGHRGRRRRCPSPAGRAAAR